MHIGIYTQTDTAVFVLHFLPSLVPALPRFSFSPLIYFFHFIFHTTYSQLFQTFSLPHSFLTFITSFLSLTYSLFPFMTLVCFPLLCIFTLLPLSNLKFSFLLSHTLSTSFDGLVVGSTDSARLELLSHYEMCCCGDDMSHFTVDW